MRLVRTLSCVVVTVATLHGCARSEPPPEVPVTTAVLATESSASASTATPAPLPVASSARASAEPVDEPDAGEEATPLDGSPTAPVSASRRAPLLRCCQALMQSAASSPPPQNMYLLDAGHYCNAVRGSVSSAQQRASTLVVLRIALHGAPLPSSCR